MTALQSDSWYLDPLVARQKAAANSSCVRRFAGNSASGTVLKTDLFEEANGGDHILSNFTSHSPCVVGMDYNPSTVSRASRRFARPGVHMTVADLRALNFDDETFDLIVSTSTLDHFDDPADLSRSLAELERVLRPGGRMIITLDNPLNPTYFPLKWTCRWFAPFHLGYTMTRRRLRAALEGLDLETIGEDYIIHNPRMISTGLFLAARRIFGRYSDKPVSLLLKAFEWCGRLPTKPLTACFSVVCVQKAEKAQTGSQAIAAD